MTIFQRYAFIPALLLFFALLPVQAPAQAPAPSAAYTPRREYAPEVVQGAVLCWNEATERRADCAAILYTRIYSAQRHGRTFAQELYYLHGDGRTRRPMAAALRSDRATRRARHDSRPWLGDVRADLHQPRGWRYGTQAWRNTAQRFERLFEYVESVLIGNVDNPCNGTPLIWGGRHTDRHLIRRRIAEGRQVLNCGATHNVFFGRRDRN